MTKPNYIKRKKDIKHLGFYFTNIIGNLYNELYKENTIKREWFNEKDRVEFDKLGGPEIYELLKVKQPEQFDKFIKHTVTTALIKDFLDYMAMSIKAIDENKVTVAYSLLRKALLDDLFHLEFILARSEEYFTNFNYDIAQLDPRHDKIKLKKAINTEATKLIKLEYYDDVLQEYRWGKNDNIINLCDKSHHLVTTKKTNATGNAYLNFVFLNREPINFESHIEYIYKIIIYNLYYSYDLISYIAKMYNIKSEFIYNIRNLAVLEEFSRIINNDKSKSVLLKEIKNHWYCEICKADIGLKTRQEFKDFIYRGITQCKECGSVCIMDRVLSCYLEEVKTLDDPKISKDNKLRIIKKFLTKLGMDEDNKLKIINNKKLFRSLLDFQN
jgi:hypothetical protein